jgi:hypothetical protein
MDYDAFVTIHEPQLRGSGVPERLYKSLFEKIAKQTFDCGEVIFLLLFPD